MHLIFVSGLSGSGKSVALHMLEDLGYYCIDNIPASLLSDLVAHTVSADDPVFVKTAVGIDARNRPADIARIPDLFDELRNRKTEFEVLFLNADDEVLLSRYRETRRKHPLSRPGASLHDAISDERQVLDPISQRADYIIDTSSSSIHDLRDQIKSIVKRDNKGSLMLEFESFGFKNRLPGDADFVFDVRCLPNPYWDIALRAYNGRDKPVVEYLDDQPMVADMLRDLTAYLETWIPRFEKNNRNHLTVAIGCTGGQHRSVYIADKLADHFRAHYPDVICRHTALTR